MGKWAKKSCLNMISKDTFLRHNCITVEYIFLTQIWSGECNNYLFKVKNSYCVCRDFFEH